MADELSTAASMAPGFATADGGWPNFQYPLVAFEFIGVASAAPHQRGYEFSSPAQLLAGRAAGGKRTRNRVQQTVLFV
jgi:hypothetical protein